MYVYIYIGVHTTSCKCHARFSKFAKTHTAKYIGRRSFIVGEMVLEDRVLAPRSLKGED